MLINLNIVRKAFHKNLLFENMTFSIKENEKTALIGRNGFGKSTLFKILTGEDKVFEGNLEIKNGTKIIMTQQEHLHNNSITPLEYILDSVVEYNGLKKIIDSEIVSEEYLEAISKFTDYGYFTIEDDIIAALNAFQIEETQILSPMINLSGGEKRFVELVRVMYSNADLALFDEPTNHMDLEGKAKFIEWVKNSKQSMIIITHDRDVLHHVNKIIEIKDHKINSFEGNYEQYIHQSSVGTVGDIHSYELDLKRLELAKKQYEESKVAKLSAKSLKGRNQAKVREERFKKIYEDIAANIKKPSFWIDQESLSNVSEEIQEKYNKYKNKNIAITFKSERQHGKLLLRAENFSLGYEKQLFNPINIELSQGDRIRLKGRNGAGKSTLLTYISNSIYDRPQISKIFSGNININQGGRLGVYKQEIEKDYLNFTLTEGVIQVYRENDKFITFQDAQAILSKYLFKYQSHTETIIKDLSGGEKARFQLIKMLVNDPNLLILDEPTNHLDLPSIEVLETFIKTFHGSIIYVSHDSYFVKNLEGKEIEIIGVE